ncbi:SGNH/GDSL hydrolase family protein [Psychrobacter cibarius]|nr:SGNH/GDSL hydrolase family protein [Psychrobacter cibarius]
MAEPITIQKLLDASIDSDTLGEFANEDKIVISRSGLDYPSAPMASRMVVENGLLGATPFTTYAAMTASALTSDSYAIVTNDANAMINGFYEKVGSTWVYLKWNPSAQAKIETADAIKKSDLSADDNYKPNIATHEVAGFYVGAGGTSLGKLVPLSNSAIQVFAVIPNQTYAIYSTNFAANLFKIGVAITGDVQPTKQTTVLTLIDTVDPLVKNFTVPSGMFFAFATTHIQSLNFDVRADFYVNEGTTSTHDIEKTADKIGDTQLRDSLAQKRIDNLDSSLRGKKWAVIGDSITAKNFRANNNYHDFIKADVGDLTVYNYGISSTGYFDRNNMVSTIIETDIDIVTVFLGTNDWGLTSAASNKPLGVFLETGTTTVSGCVNTLFTALLNKFPTKKIAILTPLPRLENWGSDAESNNKGYTLEQLCNLIKQYAAHYSLPCLDLYHGSNLTVWVAAGNAYYFTAPASSTPDGLHPNDAGHRVIADKVKAFLESI